MTNTVAELPSKNVYSEASNPTIISAIGEKLYIYACHTTYITQLHCTIIVTGFAQCMVHAYTCSLHITGHSSTLWYRDCIGCFPIPPHLRKFQFSLSASISIIYIIMVKITIKINPYQYIWCTTVYQVICAVNLIVPNVWFLGHRTVKLPYVTCLCACAKGP